MTKLIIDRFEGNYAVCESDDKSIVKIPKYKLPFGCKEGDCLIQDSEGMYQSDIPSTKGRETRLREKMSRLFG